ncbi:MAG TPA: 3-isopropylmalate dehydrogenase [Myxococcales bacterium]|nr:3-isopropylmalate dehydrogenase [Myxococcales bacterium]
MAKVAVIPGDGVGKEVIGEAVRVLEALNRARGLDLQLVPFDYGADRYLRDGVTLPDEQIAEFREAYDAILLGAIGDPRIPDNRHGREILLGLRFKLDLYVNLRPVTLYDARLCPLKGKEPKDVDFTVFRENTEGLYADVGGIFKKGTPDEIAVNEDVNTRKGVERIVRAAFEWAAAHGKQRVCMSDKANALRFAHDLWQRVFKEVGAEYPGIEKKHLYVDALAMKLIERPETFEVIVTCNLFGDILTDLGAALVGGLGISASANLNPDSTPMFEPVHGSAPDIAGKGVANPLAAMATSALLLDHLGHPKEAGILDRAVRAAVAAGQLTPDAGGDKKTRQVADFVLAEVEKAARA